MVAGLMDAFVLDFANATVMLATGLPPEVSSVTMTLVPPPAAAASATGGRAVTVDADGETARVPNVTLIGVRVRFAVGSIAVNVTTSSLVSVALKVATPEEFVVPVAGWGVIATPPVPVSFTV
jgi:hypothetical protein